MNKIISSKSAKVAAGLVGIVAGFAMIATTASAYTFSTNLKQGSTGADVKNLQVLLNMSPDTQVSVSGAGSKGMETTTFGPATKRAVIKFQNKYASETLAPAGLTAGTGFVGALTRSKLNAMGGSTTTTTPSTTTTTTVQSGPISVTLANDNPAASAVVAGQATADLMHFTFNGNGTVTNVKLLRTGVSANSTLSNVYLFQGNVRVADGAAVNNTDGTITFNNLSIAVNGSTTISVRSDIAGSTAGQIVGVQLIGYTTSGNAASTANISGNYMNVAGTTGMATVTLGANSAASASVNAGTVGYPLWTSSVQVTNRAVSLKGATFKYIGSAPTDALANVRLYVNGSPVGPTGTVNSSGNLAFDFGTSPVTLQTGATTVEVRADIIKGSSRNVKLSLQNAADIMAMDQQLGINVALSTFSVIDGGTMSINSGTVTTTTDPSFTATNVTGGSVGAPIARFKLQAYGEDVKVSSLIVTPAFATSTAPTPAANGLNNVGLFYNGVQVGSSQNMAGTSTVLTFQLGSALIITAGTSGTLEVRADIQSAASANYTGGVIVVALGVGSTNGQGMTSYSTSAVPSSTITTSGLTVSTGALSFAKAAGYLDQTVNANTNNVKIGSYSIQNTSTSESVRVTNLAVTLATSSPTYASGWSATTGTQAITVSNTTSFNAGDVLTFASAGLAPTGTVLSITNATVLSVNMTVVGVTPTVSAVIANANKTASVLTSVANLKTSETSGSGATPINPSVTNNFSVNFTLAPGQSKTIDIFADLGSSNYGTVNTTLTPTAIGASSNVTLTPGAQTGQTLTFATGSVASPTIVTAGSLVAQYIVGNSSPALAQYKFVATNGTATITELKFAVGGTSGTSSITQINVGGQTVPVVNGVAYATGLNITVPAGASGTNVTVTPTFASVGTNGVTSFTTSVIGLYHMKYTVGGVTTTNSALAASSSVMTMVGSKPTVSVAQPSGVVLTATSNVEAIDVTVTADAAGPITLNSLPITSTLNSTGGLFTAAAVVVKDAQGNTIPTTGSCTAAITCAVNILFTGGREITSIPQTFKIYLPVNVVAATSSSPNNAMNTTVVASSTYFIWVDTAGNNANPITESVPLIYNFPTTTSNIHN